MKDLGIKPEKLYDTMPHEPPTIYPTVMLPASLFDCEYQPGDTCKITIEVEIETMSKDSYMCKLLKSQEVEEAK